MHRRGLLKAASSGSLLTLGGYAGASTLLNDSVPANTSQTGFPFIDVDGRTKLYYRDWAALNGTAPAGKARTVLFVNGWAFNADMWQYQMLHLARHGVRSIAFDRRGHGRSTDPGSGYDFDTLADDLACVIETLDLRDLMLVGHSMGGGEVVRYLTRHGGSRVSQVVLVAPALPFTLKTDDNPMGVDRVALERVRKQLSTNFPQWLEQNAEPFFGPNVDKGFVGWAIAICQQASLRALIETNRAIAETDFRPELRHIQTPTLLIHGDRDVSAPLEFTGRRTEELIPRARLQVYEGAPHGLFISHMDRLNADLAAQAVTGPQSSPRAAA